MFSIKIKHFTTTVLLRISLPSRSFSRCTGRSGLVSPNLMSLGTPRVSPSSELQPLSGLVSFVACGTSRLGTGSVGPSLWTLGFLTLPGLVSGSHM